MPEEQLTLPEIESQISTQLDRLYKLLDEKTSAEFLVVEYKRVVELFAQKYGLLVQGLEGQKESLSKEQYESDLKDLGAQYKDDVIGIAVAIDETVEDYSSSDQS